MADIAIITLSVICNLIIYLAFGSLLTGRKDTKCPLLLSVIAGFFFYYITL